MALRGKLTLTFAILMLYRIGFHIPLLGVDQEKLTDWAMAQSDSTVGNVIALVGIFTGGSFSRSSIFALGIIPYVSAVILITLCAIAIPKLNQLKEEGPAGRKKFHEYTRCITAFLSVILAARYLKFLQNNQMIHPIYQGGLSVVMFWVCGITTLTAGAMLIIWMGEQIAAHGIGDGLSFIIAVAIAAAMPGAVMHVYDNFAMSPSSEAVAYGPMAVFFLLISFLFVVLCSVIMILVRRRIPIKQSGHANRGHAWRQPKYSLTLRLDQGVVMPIIFASSVMIFPLIVISGFADSDSQLTIWTSVFRYLVHHLGNMDGYMFNVAYFGMICFFTYSWQYAQFRPHEMADQLRNSGCYIPGQRPGLPTALCLKALLAKFTFLRALLMTAGALLPLLAGSAFGIPCHIVIVLCGAGMLITTMVMLDLVHRLEQIMTSHKY